MANFDLRNQEVGTQYIAGRDIAIYQQVVPLTLTDAQQRRNRKAMLDRVRTYWIKGVLDRSLSSTSLPLGLREHSNMVTESLHQDDDAGHDTRDLLPGTSLLQVYTDANSELLILGESGSGKTMLLLELARDLLDRATHDETHPIPVVFNLSSWTPKQQHLSLWLVEELVSKYTVPRKLAVSWVANDQVLPILDGLDEVTAVHRRMCVEAINTYHREHGLVPLVVSCRSADYNALQTHLQLHSTIEIQPLTAQQIDDYLTGTGEEANALRLALHDDPLLKELTTTPLLLSILVQVYQGKQVEVPISTDAPTAQRQRILAKYVERMLQQKGKQMRYKPPQMTQWLGWLAQQLALRSQTEFSIEHIQPDWLAGQRGRRVYDLLGVRLPGVLFGIAVGPIIWIASSSINDITLPVSLYYIILMMFIGGLIGGLFSKTPTQPRIGRSLLPALVAGVFITLVAASLYKLNNGSSSWNQAFRGGSSLGLGSLLLSMLVLNGFIGKVNREIFQMPVASGSLKALWSPLFKAGHLKNGTVVGLIYGLAFWLDNLLSPQQNFPPLGGLVYGLILGICGIILSVILGARESTVQPVEVLVWSWSDFGRSLANLKQLRNGVLIGATCGFMCGLTAAARAGSDAGLSAILSAILSEGLVYAVSDGLAVGLSYWLFVALLQGVSGATLNEHLRAAPNQGIRLSVQNGLFMGLISAGVSGAFAFLAVLLRNVLSDPHYAMSNSYETEGLIAALIVGLAGGLIVGLLNGWLAYIRHVVLRILLSLAGVIPSNYPDFLDEAAARILLRKIGGRYIFIHRLLLDYFAKQDTEQPKDPILIKS